jgi:hypothetical protein
MYGGNNNKILSLWGIDLEVERFQPHEKQLQEVQGCLRVKQRGEGAMKQTLTIAMQH